MEPGKDTIVAIQYHRVPIYGYEDRFIAEKREGFGWNNLGPRQIKFVTLHRMVGTLRGTDGYFRLSNISSYTDFGLSTKASDPGMTAGTIYLWNYPNGYRAPWASGPVSAPFGDGSKIVQKYGINAVNRDGISLEIGGTNEAIDAATWQEIVHFIAYWADRCKIPYTSFPVNPATGISFVLWHTEFTAGTGKQCPFMWLRERTDQLIADVKAFLKQHQTGTVAPAPAPTGIVAGDYVRFMAGMYVRSEPSLTAVAANGTQNVLTTLPTGTTGRVRSGPVVKDGHTWYGLDIDGFGGGFVSGVGLQKTAVPVPPPAPDPVWSPPKPVTELAVIDPANEDNVRSLTTVNGIEFRAIFDEVTPVRVTRQNQYADTSGKVIGPDLKPGQIVTAMYAFTELSSKQRYLYLSNHARVLEDDFTRVKD